MSTFERSTLEFQELEVLNLELCGKVNSIAVNINLLAVCDSSGLCIVYHLEKCAVLVKVFYPHEVIDLKWITTTVEPASLIFSTIEGHIGSLQIGVSSILLWFPCEMTKFYVRIIIPLSPVVKHSMDPYNMYPATPTVTPLR